MTITTTTRSGTGKRGKAQDNRGIFQPYNKAERDAMNHGIVARREARLKTIRSLMEQGLKARGISNRLGYTHVSGLINWLNTNSPALREELRQGFNPDGGRPVSRAEAVARLKLLIEIKKAGVHPTALAGWGAKNFPLADYEQALEDYGGEELELWGEDE